MMIRKSLFFLVQSLFLMTILALSQTAKADERGPYGAGLIFGEPSGLTAKYFFHHDMAVDMGLAFSFRDYIHWYSDFLYEFDDLLPSFNVSSQSRLKPSMGLGTGLRFSTKDSRDNKTHWFIRFPLMVEWYPTKPSIGLFLEATPAVGIAPNAYGDVFAGLGLRYYF